MAKFTFNKIYKKNRDKNSYSVVGTVGIDDVPMQVMKGATEDHAGEQGFVPAPGRNNEEYFLRGDGKWVLPDNTTYSDATDTSGGLMTSEDKKKLDGIEENANNYRLPRASNENLGGIQLSGDPDTILRGNGSWEMFPEDGDTHWESRLKIFKEGEPDPDNPESESGEGDETNPENPENPEEPGENGSDEENNNEVDDTPIVEEPTTIDEIDDDTINDIINYSSTEDENDIVYGISEEEADNPTIIKIQLVENDEIKNEYEITGSGQTTVNMTDDGRIIIDTNVEEYSVFVPPTDETGGVAGMVPAPQIDEQDKFLRANGTWDTPQDTTYNNATTLEAGLMSRFDKAKLDTIAEEANKYILPTATKDELGGIILDSDDSDKFLRGDGSWVIPPNSDTTYERATTSEDGLMSYDDKAKLNGIEEGANNYTYTLPAASINGLGGVQLNGDVTKFLNGNGNWALPQNTTYDESSTEVHGLLKKLSGSGDQYLNGTGNWSVPQNTTYANATTANDGLMSAGDKSKLNGIESGANNYTLPKASFEVLGGIQLDGDESTKFLRGDGEWVIPPNSDTTYKRATTSEDGLMSYVDKAKLNGIEEGANNYTYTLPAASDEALGGIILDGSPGKYLSGDGTWSIPHDTTYNNATSYSQGLMSSEDKVKLDGIDQQANNYILPAATSLALGGVRLNGTTDKYLRGDGTWDTPTNTTYANATTSSSGIMTADMVTKLNSIETGSNKYVLPEATTRAIGGIKLDGDESTKFLRGDGEWVAGGNYSEATTSTAGLMSAADKTKLDGIDPDAGGTYVLPAASTSSLGGIKLNGDVTKFLNGNGNWTIPAYPTYEAQSTYPGKDEQAIGSIWLETETEQF